MTNPTKFKLDPNERFLNESADFNEEEVGHHLTQHLEKTGFPILIYNVDMLSQEEFAESRSRTFGASDAPVLLGVAYSSKKVPMKTIPELLFEKTNKVWDEEIGKKAAVRKGRELEPMLLDKVGTTLDALVLKPKHTYWNLEGLATNFDGVVFESTDDFTNTHTDYKPVPMEIKVCSFFGRGNYNWDKGVHELDEDLVNKLRNRVVRLSTNSKNVQEHINLVSKHIGIPSYYYVQVQQQIHFLSATHGYLAVMDDINWDMYYFLVPKDQFTINNLLTVSKELYTKMLNKKV